MGLAVGDQRVGRPPEAVCSVTAVGLAGKAPVDDGVIATTTMDDGAITTDNSDNIRAGSAIDLKALFGQRLSRVLLICLFRDIVGTNRDDEVVALAGRNGSVAEMNCDVVGVESQQE